MSASAGVWAVGSVRVRVRVVCAVGVADGQGDGAADAVFGPHPGAEFVYEAEDGLVVLIGVEFIDVEAVLGGCGSGSGLWDDGPVVLAVGAGVGLSAGGGAEEPLEGGERGVCEVADAVDPVPGQGSRRRGANARQGGRALGSQERGDVVGELPTTVVEPGGVTAAAIAATIRDGPIPALDWTPYSASARSRITAASPLASRFQYRRAPVRSTSADQSAECGCTRGVMPSRRARSCSYSSSSGWWRWK